MIFSRLLKSFQQFTVSFQQNAKVFNILSTIAPISPLLKTQFSASPIVENSPPKTRIVENSQLSTPLANGEYHASKDAYHVPIFTLDNRKKSTPITALQ